MTTETCTRCHQAPALPRRRVCQNCLNLRQLELKQDRDRPRQRRTRAEGMSAEEFEETRG